MPRRPYPVTAVVNSTYPCCGKRARFRIVAKLPEQRFGREHRCAIERRNIPWVVTIRYEGQSQAGVEVHREEWVDHSNVTPIGVSA